MTIKTKNLILAPHLPRHLRALVRGTQEFENIAGLRVADGIRDQLLSASPEFITNLENAREPDPWRFGFGVIHKIDNVVIGMGGFPGPPDADGAAEIAYSIAPAVSRERLRHRSSAGAHRFCRKRFASKTCSRTHSRGNERFHSHPGKMRF